MLTLTKKLCAKLMTNWVKKPMSKIIDSQQNRFLKGTNIMDNLLTYKMAQEVVTQTKQKAILLKANFMKAYDRIEHLFISASIEAMVYHPHIIRLTKGPVEGG